jgi:hypothetical protein
MGLIDAVKCDGCGKVMDFESKDFFRVDGNIYIGYTGGIIGGAEPEAPTTFLCVPCFMQCVEQAAGIPKYRDPRIQNETLLC